MNKYRIIFTGFLLLLVVLMLAGSKVKLVILHTNDTHSQVEPTQRSKMISSNMGGYARIIGRVNEIRKKEKNVLVFDAGDFSQGTPFYNFFNGRVEIAAFNRMGYDAITFGNHEFDNGVDTLFAVLKQTQLPMISSNYVFENSTYAQRVKPYMILRKAGLKIGVIAVNIKLDGLVFEKNLMGVKYKDAVQTALTMSAYLKTKLKCDVVICLSHIGANTTLGSVNDMELAKQSKYIDVIIGGHSHSLFENILVLNALGKNVVVAQMGKSGYYLGRIDLELIRK